MWSRQTKQIWNEHFLKVLTGLCTVGTLSLLLLMLLGILLEGGNRLSVAFLFSPSEGVGLQGGVLYQILGTCLLMGVSAVIVCPFSVALALLYTTFLKNTFAKRVIFLLLQMLNGTPSIIFGILGFIVFVSLWGWHKSWLAGAIILALMILPTVTIALIDRIQTIPRNYLEAAAGLGFRPGTLVRAVIIPYGWGGLLTGLMLGLARAAGETAPIMFTAAVFSGATFPEGIRESPVLALPYHIFNLAQDVYGEGAQETAWASATVLVSLVFVMSALVLPLRLRSHEEAKR